MSKLVVLKTDDGKYLDIQDDNSMYLTHELSLAVFFDSEVMDKDELANFELEVNQKLTPVPITVFETEKFNELMRIRKESL